MVVVNGSGNTPTFWFKVTFVPVGIFALYGKFKVLLDLSATQLWVTLAFTVGADKKPRPGLVTLTLCITSFSITGSRTKSDPLPPVRTISGIATKFAPPSVTSR